MKKNQIVALLIVCFAVLSCQQEKLEGKLFIIGGGKVNTSMRDKMIESSGIDKGGYMVVLPMSSEEEPLENIEEIRNVYNDKPDIKIFGFNIQKGDTIHPSLIDSIRNARLIYISGGDQSRFMDIIKGTEIKNAIHDAYHKGAVIAGTSAGASLMSKIMVTGNELKHPVDGNFSTIEPANVETIEGLGLLEKVTIDQHFVVRKRLNRMITYSIENPNHTCVGIDEATAIFVEGNKATVYGVGQVVVLKNGKAKTKVENNLLGATGLKLDVFLPGDSFKLSLQ